jgi:hypothetical protein
MDAVKENESKQPKTGGRKEKLPSWYVKPYEHSAAEMDNIRRLLAENESPEAQAEREQLAKDLQAFGRSG